MKRKIQEILTGVEGEMKRIRLAPEEPFTGMTKDTRVPAVKRGREVQSLKEKLPEKKGKAVGVVSFMGFILT